MATIDELVARCIERGWANVSDIQGCTEAEVEEVTARQGVPLPAAYREFLLKMGRGAGALMGGSDIFFSFPLIIREWAVELLADNGNPFLLPKFAVVFWMHQGYQFLFLRPAEGDDPPVYYYLEGAQEAVRQHEHFTDFLESEIERLSDQEIARYRSFVTQIEQHKIVTIGLEKE